MKKKLVLITGATSGIGAACARKFAADGYRLILTGRRAEKLNMLKEELEKEGAEVLPLVFDVRDREASRTAIGSLPEEWRSVDVLINNAGLALGLDKEYAGSEDDWATMIDTNIKGLLTMTRLIVPGMVERNHGHVINIGSVAGDAAYAGGNVYCATKAAVKILSDGLRIDVADTAVRVTTIKPGLVETKCGAFPRRRGPRRPCVPGHTAAHGRRHSRRGPLRRQRPRACADSRGAGAGHPSGQRLRHRARPEPQGAALLRLAAVGYGRGAGWVATASFPAALQARKPPAMSTTRSPRRAILTAALWLRLPLRQYT